jgi:hypothetical protein
MIGGLSLLQTSGQRTIIINAAQLKNELIQKINTLHDGATNQDISLADCKTIDLIMLLFDTIIKDSSVPKIIKPLLLRLRIPVLKCAILDPNIFTDRYHPSRNLLNGLVHNKLLANGRDGVLFPRLESIVDVLVGSFDQDIAPFQIAVDSLNGLIDKRSIKLIGSSKRAVKEDSRQNTQTIVLKEISHQVHGNNFPKSARKLILKYWCEVMVYQYSKYGVDSEQWLESIATLKQLVAICKIKNDGYAIGGLDANFPALRKKIVAELVKIKLKPDEVRDALEGLKTAIQATGENKKRAARPSGVANGSEHSLAHSKSDDSGNVSAIESGKKSIRSRPEKADNKQTNQPVSLKKLPTDLKPGTWVNLHGGQRNPKTLAKLSVVIPETATMIFIDKEGFKYAEKQVEEFLNELDSGLSTVVAEDSLIDKALSSVISSLGTY